MTSLDEQRVRVEVDIGVWLRPSPSGKKELIASNIVVARGEGLDHFDAVIAEAASMARGAIRRLLEETPDEESGK
jgi:hypothetical protein